MRNAARQAARARASQPVATSQDAPVSDPVAERKKRLEARYAASRASQSPQDAGIPLGKGAAAKGKPRATAPRPERRQAAAAAAAVAGAGVVVAADPEPAVSPLPPTAPVVTRAGAQGGDPLANELVRSGDGFVFKGSLNGKPVLFMLNDKNHGLVVPATVAVSHGLVPASSPAVQGTSEMYTPVQSMSVGTHPVSAVMARISASKSPYVQVGVDALQAFKVVLENGRRMLVPNPVAE
ncbi:MAG: hypothetical protein E6R08_00385 [Nevskiaceae bacterium]|nr:MAG: hypothetical protein E6R08_00385 [Nevskiaceae bacterium]